MNKKLASSLLAALPLSAMVLSTGEAALRVGAAPTTAPTVAPAPKRESKVKAFAKLAVKNAAAVPGETRTFEATLTVGSVGAPLAGKSVVFRLEGKDGTTVPGGSIAAGSATTDAKGKARLAFEVPELAQGAYRLHASFAGDDATRPASAEGNFGMVKGLTQFEMGDLLYGPYKNEPGTTATVMITLRRRSDQEPLRKSFWITVNGQRWEIKASSSSSSTRAIPLDVAKGSWNVKVEFEGDAANQATTAQRSYTKPS